MKAHITLFMLLLCSIAKSQNPFPLKNGSVYYEKITEFPDGKDVLYAKAKKWFVDTYRNSKAVIELDDKEAGKIIGKGKFSLTDGNALMIDKIYVDYTIMIDVKDNKYRLTLYNIQYGYYVYNNSPLVYQPRSIEAMFPKLDKNKKQESKLAKKIDAELKMLISELNLSMMLSQKDNF